MQSQTFPWTYVKFSIQDKQVKENKNKEQITYFYFFKTSWKDALLLTTLFLAPLVVCNATSQNQEFKLKDEES